MRYRKLSKKLRKLRMDAGLSQLHVSEALGYSTTQFVSNWERGLSYPPIKSLFLLAELYKVRAELIYTMIEDEIIRDVKTSMKNEFQESV